MAGDLPDTHEHPDALAVIAAVNRELWSDPNHFPSSANTAEAIVVALWRAGYVIADVKPHRSVKVLSSAAVRLRAWLPKRASHFDNIAATIAEAVTAGALLASMLERRQVQR